MPPRTTVLALLLAGVAAAPALAAPAGVAELLRQAEFWNGKGRHDLARQALQRVLAIDPDNAQAKRALSGAASAPKPQAPQQQAQSQQKPRAATPQPVRPRATAAAATASRDPGGAARAEGFEALEAGNLARAEARFQAALRLRSQDADALGGLGLVYLREERFAEARDLLQRASRLGSAGKWADALHSASFFADLRGAEAARDAGRLREAEVTARGLAESGNPDAALARALLAEVLSQQGRHEEASAIYAGLSASGGPSASSANQLRARAARERALQAIAAGDAATAEGMFQSAIVSDTTDPWMRYEYARFLVSQGRTAAAISTMQPLNTSSTPDGFYAAALFANQIGRTAAASALMARIPAAQLTEPMKGFLVELKTNEAIAQAQALQKSGRTAEALNGLRSIASRGASSVGTLSRLAQALYDLGDAGGAQALAQQAMQAPLAEPDAYTGLVSVLARSGQDAVASSIVQRLSEEGKDVSAVAALSATLAAAQADRLRLAGQHAMAFDLLQQAWASAPNNVEILGALGRLYQSGGLPGQAVQVYDMLLRQSPDDVGALTGLADAAGAARDFERARAAIRRAIELRPTDTEVYLTAARVERARGDEGAAVKYLRKARELYTGRTALANGVFPAANPFAAGSAASWAAPVNPFALASSPAPMSYDSGLPIAPPTAPPPAYLVAAQSSHGAAIPMSAPFPTGYPAPAPVPPPGATYHAAPARLTDRRPTGPMDPQLARIDREIAELQGKTSVAIDASTSFRSRSGEAGLSKLTAIGARLSASAPLAGGRVAVTATPVVLDAGSPSRSGLARFGSNPTGEAIGIVEQQPSALAAGKAQHDAGIAVSASYENDLVKADVGTTPLGFARTDVQGSVRVTPRIGRNVTLGVHAERRPVTDSVVSYAGARDPVTGEHWGSVMRNGGGASFSFDKDGSGIYADAAYRKYQGRNVRANDAVEANIGGYIGAYRDANSTLAVGGNVNYQAYGNNQNHFSLGHGGYFSPQSFISLAFPVRYDGRFGQWKVNAEVSPGYQSYKQDEMALFPTRPDLQAQLDLLKGVNDDVRARYDSLSKSGFALAGNASASYQLSSATKLYGEIKYNTFGVYDEFQTMVGIRQGFGGSGK